MRILLDDGRVIVAPEEFAELLFPGKWRVAERQDEPNLSQPVPGQVTRRQGLLALLSYGIKRSDIEAVIASIEDDNEREAAQIEYESATWERSNARVQSMWAALDGTPEQLDDLFRLAVTL